MRAKYAVLNREEVVAMIYEHEKFGKVVVFRVWEIQIDDALQIYNMETAAAEDKVDLLNLIIEVLPHDQANS